MLDLSPPDAWYCSKCSDPRGSLWGPGPHADGTVRTYSGDRASAPCGFCGEPLQKWPASVELPHVTSVVHNGR